MCNELTFFKKYIFSLQVDHQSRIQLFNFSKRDILWFARYERTEVA